MDLPGQLLGFVIEIVCFLLRWLLGLLGQLLGLLRHYALCVLIK